MPELRTPQGHVLLLPPGGVSVGEDPHNDVPIARGFGLAAVHFRLGSYEGGHFIEDAGSGLGTLVNGAPVTWRPLRHGDVITAGDLQLMYHLDASARGGAPTMPVHVVVSTPEPPPPPPPPSWAPAGEGPVSAPPPEPGPHSVAPPAWLPEELLPQTPVRRPTDALPAPRDF